MVSSDEAMRGAFLAFASEAAQIEGGDDRYAREYAVIRSLDLDSAVVELIVDALALCSGSVWRPESTASRTLATLVEPAFRSSASATTRAGAVKLLLISVSCSVVKERISGLAGRP